MIGYLYRHIRLDTNQPFYIGISKVSNPRRAYTTFKRNKIWYDIVAKTDYEIEIMLDEVPINELESKEIEFIKLYGRIDLGTGTLANMTDGGEGTLGSKHNLGKHHSKETKNKIANTKKGFITNYNKSQMKKINQFDLQNNFIKEWDCIENTKHFGFQAQNVRKCCKSTRKTHGGFIWKYAEN